MSYYNMTLDLPWQHTIIALGNSPMGDVVVLVSRDHASRTPFSTHTVDAAADRGKPMPVGTGGYFKMRSAAIKDFSRRLARGLQDS